jgi:Rad3-related DNA helicase
MRRSADKGVVAALDGRILKKSYGNLFRQALPETKTSYSELNNILQDIENILY